MEKPLFFSDSINNSLIKIKPLITSIRAAWSVWFRLSKYVDTGFAE